MNKSGYSFGTFKGVFTPSILTILGVIMYLRLGWVLGNMGLPLTLLIVTVSMSIMFLTAFSLSALATNMRVSVGGAYFILSRSLGIEAGASVGLPLFLAQAVGVSFYIAGFSESVVAVFPTLSETMVGVITLFVIAFLAFTSANLALKSQIPIMAVIGLSLISFFLGGTQPTPVLTETLAPIARQSFWVVFAVFFPAVTGILAGVGMSGDLKDPAYSLPRGTFAALLVGFAIYLTIPVYFHFHVSDPEQLITNSFIMRDISRWGNLIVLGIWGASLSSAMGALLGAPRTLQALAYDGVLPRIIGRGYGKGNDPRLATVVTFAIALAGVVAGGIDVIAPILTMFSLTTYGALNLSAGLETLVGSASWRPTFKTHWGVSMIGALCCFLVMIMINPGAAFIAVFCCFVIYCTLTRRRLRAHWGDLRHGLLMALARSTIYKLAESKTDEHSWKPNLLVLSGVPSKRWYLLELADAIARENCLTTTALVLPEETPNERIRTVRQTIREYLKRKGVPSLVKVVKAPDVMEGLLSLINTYGFGPISPNTILIGDTEEREQFEAYTRLIMAVWRRQRNFICVRETTGTGEIEEERETAGDRYIELWWQGKGNNAWFMLALAHLLGMNPAWAGTPLRLNTVIQKESERADAENRLQTLIQEARLTATFRVIE
ncbi:MAG: amino acid permease, partial [Candidatus Hydrogenedentes bacterium]|nr:amino acid permease [Candidatus Hydrogenedentota bacterium]